MRLPVALTLLVAVLFPFPASADAPPRVDMTRGDLPDVLAPPAYDAPFTPNADYDPAVPAPADVLGGTALARPATGDEIRRVLQAIADASPRVRLETYGYSHEGRPLWLAIVGSPERIAGLEEMKRDRRRLFDPDGEEKGFERSLPLVAWIGAAVHGSEPSGADGALALVHHLAADRGEETARLLSEVVVVIDPLQNPDGRARFMSRFHAWDSRVPVTDPQSRAHRNVWPGGRGNHYLLDLNRDWFALSQPETRARVRVLLDWQPQVGFDLHEMGANDTYLFSPPREPYNPYLPATTRKWWETLAADIAGAFGGEGWSCYNRDWHEEFNPNRGAGWPLLSGAVTFLGEQSTTHGRAVLRSDGNVLTFREAVHHQFTAALNLIRAAAKHRAPLLADYVANRRAGRGEGAYIVDGAHRPDLVARFAEALEAQGIAVRTAAEPFKAGRARDYYGAARGDAPFCAGSRVIDLDQPQGRLARGILAFDPRLGDEFVTAERRSLERGDGSLLYESPAWSLAMAYGLEVYEAERLPSVTFAEKPAAVYGGLDGEGEFGYLLDPREPNADRALALLHTVGLRCQGATSGFVKGGRSYPAGTVLVKRTDNGEYWMCELDQIARRTGATFRGVRQPLTESGPDLGARAWRPLVPPRVGLLTGAPFYQTTCGALWHYFDRELGLPCSLLRLGGFDRLDLEPYNVIIAPNAAAGAGETLPARLGPEGMAKLADWVRRGGTLITLGEANWLVFGGETPLGQLRARRQVLETLPAYAEEADRVWRHERLRVDEAALRAGDAEAIRPAQAPETGLEPAPVTEERDAWLRRFSPQGAFVTVELDSEHWMTAGVGDRVPVLVKSDLVLMGRSPVRTIGRFAGSGDLRLSGLLWPEAEERLAASAYLGREACGDGQVVFFAGNPAYRAYCLGTSRLLGNAVLLGAGLGAN